MLKALITTAADDILIFVFFRDDSHEMPSLIFSEKLQKKKNKKKKKNKNKKKNNKKKTKKHLASILSATIATATGDFFILFLYFETEHDEVWWQIHLQYTCTYELH